MYSSMNDSDMTFDVSVILKNQREKQYLHFIEFSSGRKCVFYR